MRKVRGAQPLRNYLVSIHCPMSTKTIYRLVRDRSIPFTRPAPQILIFDLDDIDSWLSGGMDDVQTH